MSEERPCPICGRDMEIDAGWWSCLCGHRERNYQSVDEA